MAKPEVSDSLSKRELDRAEAQFDKFDKEIKSMTHDRMNEAPKEEKEMQTKLSQKEIANSKDVYLKPQRTINDNQKFNEKFRESYNFAKEFVHFIAENKEIIGESLEIWTHPYGGVGAEYWVVPVNKPVWGPRYLAEQIKRKYYHRLVMQDNKVSGADGMGHYYGTMAVDTTVQRLDAHPVSERKSVFMGSSSFK